MTQANPFNDSFKDVFKLFGDFNKAPAFDTAQLVQSQRRNTEIVSALSQVFTESLQAVVRRQTEILQSGTTDLLQLVKDVTASPSPEATVATQTAFAKNSLENALSNTRELAEMVSKSGIEAFDVLSKKLSENVSDSLNASKKKAA